MKSVKGFTLIELMIVVAIVPSSPRSAFRLTTTTSRAASWPRRTRTWLPSGSSWNSTTKIVDLFRGLRCRDSGATAGGNQLHLHLHPRRPDLHHRCRRRIDPGNWRLPVPARSKQREDDSPCPTYWSLPSTNNCWVRRKDGKMLIERRRNSASP